MSLSLPINALLSRVIRANASNGQKSAGMLSGIGGALPPVAVRKISNLTRLKPDPGPLGLLQKIWNPIASFVGFLGGVIKGIAFSATSIWQWVVNGVERLKAFNWNATDKQLEETIKSQNIALASIWGGTLGQGFGWLVGIGVGYGVSFLCPVIGGAALARLIASKTATEALEELLPRFKQALTATATTLATNALVSGYINYRKFLKQAPESFLTSVFGKDTAKFIKNVWGNEGGPDMSFNNQMDEAIDSIQNPYVKAFLEEFFEEAWDGFTEAGFIVASELDNAYAQNKLNQKMTFGPERTVEITPDVSAPDETIKLVQLPQTLVFPAIQQSLTTHRLMYNRDIGEVVGEPYESWVRARPQLRSLTIQFMTRDKPPWRELTGKRCKRAHYTIPDVRRGLTWQEIKTAASPFNWGRFRATANMDSGRQMAVYGASAAEAQGKLKQLALLSESKILSLSISEEEERPVGMKKQQARMFPAYATLLARRNSVDNQGRKTLDGRTLDEEVVRIPLWVPTEPRNLVIPTW